MSSLVLSRFRGTQFVLYLLRHMVKHQLLCTSLRRGILARTIDLSADSDCRNMRSKSLAKGKHAEPNDLLIEACALSQRLLLVSVCVHELELTVFQDSLAVKLYASTLQIK